MGGPLRYLLPAVARLWVPRHTHQPQLTTTTSHWLHCCLVLHCGRVLSRVAVDIAHAHRDHDPAALALIHCDRTTFVWHIYSDTVNNLSREGIISSLQMPTLFSQSQTPYLSRSPLYANALWVVQ